MMRQGGGPPARTAPLAHPTGVRQSGEINNKQRLTCQNASAESRGVQLAMANRSLPGIVLLEPTPPGWTVTLNRDGRPPDRRAFIALYAARQCAVDLAEREGLLLVDRSAPDSEV